MPKQRNHPHHHPRGGRGARRGGLQLPQYRNGLPFLGASPYVNPPGWATRPPNGRLLLRIGLFAVGFVVAALLLGGLLGGALR